MAGNKLTDRALFAGVLTSSDLLHIVDVTDSSQDPAGSSFKVQLGQLSTYFGIGNTLATVLANGNVTGGKDIVVTNGDFIKLGTSGVGKLYYDNSTNFVGLENTTSTDYLKFFDAGSFKLKSATGAISADGIGNTVQLDWDEGLNQMQLFNLNGMLAVYTAKSYMFHDTLIELDAPEIRSSSVNTVNINWYASNTIRLDASNIKIPSLTANYLPMINGSNNLTDSPFTVSGTSDLLLPAGKGIDVASAGAMYIGQTTASTIYYGNASGVHNFLGASITASRVATFDASKNLVASSISLTELGYLSGATSNIQNQLNNLAIGIGGWKSAARVMSSTNVTVASPGATIDGVTMAANDRVVLNGQSTGSQNGVYVWNGAAVPMTRATDCTTGDSSNTGVLGMVITIEEGTYADQFWVLTNNAPITIGSTSLVYAKGSATTYTGSNGITLTGNNFTLDNSYFSGDATVSGGVITIGAGKVTNSMLAGSIDYSKLASMTSANLASILSDETGTGFVVFNDSPTFTTNVTLNSNTTFTPTVNSSLSGANQRIPSHTTANMVFTNVGLTSIGSANNGGVSAGHTLCISNNTGASITIVNNYGGASAGEAIITGMGADITLLDKSSIWLMYNSTASAWETVSGGLIPVSTGISGLGTGIATFLATPSSANLYSALTTKTGNTSNVVFADSPTFVTRITSPELDISGTGGSGFINLVAQSSNTSAPSATGLNLFAGSTGNLRWAKKNGTDTYVRGLVSTLTADTDWTFPDMAGTVALATGITGGQTLTGGTAVGDALNLKGTTGNGTSTVASINLLVGNNGATTAMAVYNSGQINIGTYGSPTAQRVITIGDTSQWVSIGAITTSATSCGFYVNQATPSGSNYSFNLTSTNTSVNAPSSTLNLQTSAGTRCAITSNTVIFTPGATTGGTVNFTWTSANSTAVTASTNVPKFLFTLGSAQWNTGSVTNADLFQIAAPTITAVAASTFTYANTLLVSQPVQSTNATLTNKLAAILNGSVSIGISTSPTLGGGDGVLFIANASTDPTTNPTGGGILYVSGGALKYRGSSGTVTTIANA